ncbi:MAG: ribonuclease P protein component [Oscillospiraceae bacterium]
MLFTEPLKDNKVYQKLYRAGKFAASREVTCYFLRSREPVNFLGITAGKKIGGAVERNRAKRIVRAAYRLCEAEMPIGYQLVFVARTDIAGKTSRDLEGFIRRRLIPEMNKQAQKELSGTQKAGNPRGSRQ